MLAGALAQAAERLKPVRYQVILGPRRVGKTTVMYQVVQDLLDRGLPPEKLVWVRLDHPQLLDVPLGTLLRSLLGSQRTSNRAPSYVFLDEITYAADWDLWLKTFHDERWPVRVVATSSSSAVLAERRLESGVGRWEEQLLPPCLLGEYLALRGAAPPVPAGTTLAETLCGLVQAPPSAGAEAELRRYLLVGGFPELITAGAADEPSDILRSQLVLRADAIQAAIYRDLPQVVGIDEPVRLERLLYTLAGQMGGVLSPKSLASDIGLSVPTVEKYIAYLERAFLIFTLPNYSASEESIQRRGRKLFFHDGAVRNAAIERGLAPARDAAEMGLLHENAVAAHLHALAELEGTRLYFWRRGRDEVDLVLDHPEHPLAFEVASRARHAVRGLAAFQAEFPRFRGACYLVAPSLEPREPSRSKAGVGQFPLDAFLMAVTAQVAETVRRRLAD